MKYYVVWPDGQRFGPADVDTLTQWAAEGRLQETTELEDAATGARLSAASVPGLIFTSPAPAQPAAPSSPYETPVAANPYQETPSNPYGPVSNPYQNPPSPSGSNYPRQTANYDDGSADLTKAWIFGVVGFFCCVALTFVGIYFAVQAKKKGNSGAQAALVVNVILVSISIIATIAWIAMVAATGFPG